MKTPIIFIGFLWKCKTMFQQHCVWGKGEEGSWPELLITVMILLLHENAFWVPHKWVTNELSEFTHAGWGDCLRTLFENHCSSILSSIKKSAALHVNKLFSNLNNFAASICSLLEVHLCSFTWCKLFKLIDPETLTADKKLLGAAVLLTSHLSHTPSELEAIPSSSPPSVSLYHGACTPAVSGHEVQFAAELLIKHPALQGLLIFRIAGCRQRVRESDRSVLTFFYNEGSLGRNVDALGMKAFYVCALRDPFGAVGCLSWDLLQPLSGVESLDLMPSRALFSAQCPLKTTSPGFFFYLLKGLWGLINSVLLD